MLFGPLSIPLKYRAMMAPVLERSRGLLVTVRICPGVMKFRAIALAELFTFLVYGQTQRVVWEEVLLDAIAQARAGR